MHGDILNGLGIYASSRGAPGHKWLNLLRLGA